MKGLMTGEAGFNCKEFGIILIAQAIILVPLLVLGMRCSPKQQALHSASVQTIECTTVPNTKAD